MNLKKMTTVEGSAYREDRRAFAGLDESGSEAQWFLPALQIPSSQTEPSIGNYLPAQRSDQRIVSPDSTTIINEKELKEQHNAPVIGIANISIING
jgi:hypothetical protein